MESVVPAPMESSASPSCLDSGGMVGLGGGEVSWAMVESGLSCVCLLEDADLSSADSRVSIRSLSDEMIWDSLCRVSYRLKLAPELT